MVQRCVSSVHRYIAAFCCSLLTSCRRTGSQSSCAPNHRKLVDKAACLAVGRQGRAFWEYLRMSLDAWGCLGLLWGALLEKKTMMHHRVATYLVKYYICNRCHSSLLSGPPPGSQLWRSEYGTRGGRPPGKCDIGESSSQVLNPVYISTNSFSLTASSLSRSAIFSVASFKCLYDTQTVAALGFDCTLSYVKKRRTINLRNDTNNKFVFTCFPLPLLLPHPQFPYPFPRLHHPIPHKGY